MDLCNQGTILHNVSSGLHESQSRLFENYLGRSYHFWDTLYPELQKIFHEELKDVDQMMFYKAINHIDHFKEGKLLTWLCAIARHTYFDYVKKKEYYFLLLK